MEHAFYEVLQSFQPSSTNINSLAVEKGDVLLVYVQSPSHYQNGWLYAYNQCKRTKGYVPVELVKLIGTEKNNTIHHPSALGIEIESVMSETDKVKTSHQLTNIYIASPVFCVHCNDYIWDLGKLAITCSGMLIENIIIQIRQNEKNKLIQITSPEA